MFTFIEISKRQTFMNVRLQVHSSNCLLIYIKGKPKQSVGVSKVQSVFCEDAMRGLKISIIQYLSNNCLIIVIVYAKDINRVITNKAIFLFTSSSAQWHTKVCK